MDTTPAEHGVPTPIARFDSAWPARTGWNLRFSLPRFVHVAREVDEVLPVLHAVDRGVADGAWAVVALAYEAAAAFEPAYRFLGAPDVPLVWAAIFDGPDDVDGVADAATARAAPPPHDASFRPLLDRTSFRGRVESVQRHIAAGDTYQVNLTFPLRGRAPSDVDGWYERLCRAQRAGFCARLDLGNQLVVSLSPELFFERRGTLVLLDRRSGEATLGVGAGITADSVADDEYDECLLKGAFAASDAATRRRTASPAWPRDARPAFSLLETMPLAQGIIARRARHVARMAASAAYFGFAWRQHAVDEALDAAAAAHPTGTWRLRLLVDAQGVATLACTPFAPDGRRWRVAVSSTRVDGRDPLLCNKTTHREPYDEARALRPDVDEVLLVNEAGELTEATVANLVVEIDGVAWTPARECGLLGGTYRDALIEAGRLVERRLTPADLERARSVWLVNSLRGRIEVDVVA